MVGGLMCLSWRFLETPFAACCQSEWGQAEEQRLSVPLSPGGSLTHYSCKEVKPITSYSAGFGSQSRVCLEFWVKDIASRVET